MRKLVASLVLCVMFACGLAVGLLTTTAQASERCWSYCDAQDRLIQCCEGIGCWVQSPTCPF